MFFHGIIDADRTVGDAPGLDVSGTQPGPLSWLRVGRQLIAPQLSAKHCCGGWFCGSSRCGGCSAGGVTVLLRSGVGFFPAGAPAAAAVGAARASAGAVAGTSAGAVR